MIRFARILPPLLLLSLSVSVLSCDLMETGELSGNDIGEVVDIGATLTEVIGATASDMSSDPDPAVQAAGESPAAAERERNKGDDPIEGFVLNELENARSSGNNPPSAGNNSPPSSSEGSISDQFPMSPDDARALVEQDPRSYDRRLNQAAAQVAAGESPEAAKAAALYLMATFLPETLDARTEYLFWYMATLEVSLKGADEGTPEYQRLLVEYCAQAELWKTTQSGSFEFLRAQAQC